MSFAADTKIELSGSIDSARHCRLAELTAITARIGRYSLLPGGGVIILWECEKIAPMRAVGTLVRKLFHVSPEISVISGASLGKNRLYTMVLKNPEIAAEALTEMGYMKKSGVLVDLGAANSDMIPTRQCCQRAYLKGVFLCCGSISDPAKSYHIELSLATKKRAEDMQSLISGFGITSRVAARKDRFVVYVKESESIVDLLGVLGATKALLELENIRILHDISGNINRQVNCETANLRKTVSAGLAQVKQIETIISKKGVGHLPAELADVAKLRLENPDMPIAELGQLLDPPLGKSGIYHRFERIKAIAQQLERES